MRGCGRIARPAFPAPSDLQKAGRSWKTSRASRGEIAKLCLRMNAPHTQSSSPAKAGDPVFRGASDRAEKPRRTGYPACAGYDGCWWRRASVFCRHCEERKRRSNPYFVIPGWCASTRPGISRFRARCFASPRNDDFWIASRSLSSGASSRDPLAPTRWASQRRCGL
jgi:hypothetical protein